ncbi:MAG: response regulator [Flavobacteriales bacterium]|nr:response regulator [Flavobacteriales bacterium]
MKKILLIEDNKDVRENTAEILELASYRVFAAENGKMGVEMAQGENPDLIICDIMMPVLDGYGVLHLLGKNEKTAGIPFIFLTAKAERTDVRKGMEMGADDYITKPFDDIELLNAVESRLKKAEALRKEVPATADGVSDLISKVNGLEDIVHIAQRQQVKSFRKRSLVFSEGDTPSGLYLLNSGKIKICKSHEMGKSLITRLIHPGEFFGFLPLLEGNEHSSSAEALEDCEVTIFPQEDFFRLIERSPQVAQQFIKMLAGNMTSDHEKLVALAYSSVRKRTADALLTLKKRYQENAGAHFSMAIAREDLANIVGTATESLIRTLSDFREEEIISISGSSITILDEQKLTRMKN